MLSFYPKAYARLVRWLFGLNLCGGGAGGSEISRRGHWKFGKGYLHKIVWTRLSNLWQFCDNFRVMYKRSTSKLAAIWAVFRGPRMGRWIRGRWICVFWGAPIFSQERFGAKIWGAPNADPTTMNPTPHSRPSENLRIAGLRRFARISDILSTGVWCIPEFGAGFAAGNKSPLFQNVLLLSAVWRALGQNQKPHQTPVRTKLRLKRFPRIARTLWKLNGGVFCESIRANPNLLAALHRMHLKDFL